MNNATWNDLKGKVMAVHGPNIDWFDVRHQVDVYLTGPFQDRMSAVDAFNSVYRFKPIPYRNNVSVTRRTTVRESVNVVDDFYDIYG
jgi:hypothetical protein